MHAVAEGLAPVVIGHQVAGEVGEHRLPGRHRAGGVQLSSFRVGVGIEFPNVVRRVVIAVVLDPVLAPLDMVVDLAAAHLDPGVGAGIVGEAARLQQLGPGEALPPAGVVDALATEPVRERKADRLPLA